MPTPKRGKLRPSWCMTGIASPPTISGVDDVADLGRGPQERGELLAAVRHASIVPA